MNKRLILSLGAIGATALPIMSVVACQKTPEEKKEVMSIDLDTTSKIKMISGAMSFYNVFIKKDKSLEYKKYDLHLVVGNVDTHAILSKDEVQQVRSADEEVQVSGGELKQMSFDGFKDIAQGLVGETIYMLGDKNKRNKHTTKVSLESFKTKFVNKVLGGILPESVEILKVSKNGREKAVTEIGSFIGKTQKYSITFKEKTTNNKFKIQTKINIDKKQSTVDKHESKGGKFKQAVTAVKGKLQSFMSKVKTFATITKDKVNNWGDIMVGLTENIVDYFVEKAEKIIPALGIVLHIPILGNKVIGFIQKHITHPIVERMMKPIAEKFNKKEGK